MAYTIETIIAEKFHSIIFKNVTNTRAKDYYDLYMLLSYHQDKINSKNLATAIKNTFSTRKTKFDVEYFKEIITFLEDNKNIKKVFRDYQKKLEYAKDIKYEDTIKILKKIVNFLENEFVKYSLN